MKVIFVPTWLQDALARSGNTANVILANGLESIISKQDLVFYEAINHRSRELLSNAFKETFTGLDHDYTRSQQDQYLYQAAYQRLSLDKLTLESFLKACADPFEPTPVEEMDLVGKRLGFTLLCEKDDVFFVTPKAVSRHELLLCYDELFSVLLKKYGIERVAGCRQLLEEYFNSLAA